MGNAFAAFTVITAGIGVPFVISQGGNPAVIGVLGMTAGYCGTLMTPMAANFNIVPCAVLETKDPKWAVIKAQLPMAQKIQSRNIPASISNTAGTFVCNHVTYGVCHLLATKYPGKRSGFIHIPYLPQQVLDKKICLPCRRR